MNGIRAHAQTRAERYVPKNETFIISHWSISSVSLSICIHIQHNVVFTSVFYYYCYYVFLCALCRPVTTVTQQRRTSARKKPFRRTKKKNGRPKHIYINNNIVVIARTRSPGAKRSTWRFLIVAYIHCMVSNTYNIYIYACLPTIVRLCV